MLGLLAKIIPLDLAATLSPGILAVALILLGSKFHPMIRTLALFLGTLLVGIGITLLGFFLGRAAPIDLKQNLFSAVIDLFFGLFFILFGMRALLSKERTIKPQDEEKSQIFKWLIVGIILSATNFDALFLNFTAAKEVGATQIDDGLKLILLLVNLLFFTLPVLLPFLLYLMLPNLAGRLLSKLNQFVFKYSKYIIFILFGIFGLIFLFRGLKFFL